MSCSYCPGMTLLADTSPLDPHRILSEPAAAHMLGVSPDTLRRMAGRGEGPRRIKLSQRRVGYRLRECIEWIDARAAESAA
jgi:predicted DNA-binding transcriptional regulator AlpA